MPAIIEIEDAIKEIWRAESAKKDRIRPVPPLYRQGFLAGVIWINRFLKKALKQPQRNDR